MFRERWPDDPPPGRSLVGTELIPFSECGCGATCWGKDTEHVVGRTYGGRDLDFMATRPCTSTVTGRPVGGIPPHYCERHWPKMRP